MSTIINMRMLPRNCARLAVITGVTNFLMFLSKIVVVGLCAALSYILFSGQIKVVFSSFLLVVTFFLLFAPSSQIVSPLLMAIDASFLPLDH